jgi:hypothetical protein
LQAGQLIIKTDGRQLPPNRGNNLISKLCRLIAFGIAFFALSSPLHAQDSMQLHRFAIPGQGFLQLSLPAEWRTASRSIETPASLALGVGPRSGDAFHIQVTTVWLDPEKRAGFTSEETKTKAQSSADKLLPEAVEKTASLLELRGKEAQGYYYSLTAKALAAPKDFQYTTQGILRIADTVTIFTILHREPAFPEKEQVLQALANATFMKSETAAADKPKPSGLQVTTLEKAYEVTVPQSRIVLTLPKDGFLPAKNPYGGAANSPGYFYFTDAASGAAISGWLEPAEKFTSVKESWDNATRDWDRTGVPAAQDVVFQKIDNWEAVLYEREIPGITNSHIRAHLVQAGTWIDMHLSMTERSPVSEVRARLLALIKRIQVGEKK